MNIEWFFGGNALFFSFMAQVYLFPYFTDVFFFSLTVGRGIAELWSRLLLFQLLQLDNQLSNVP